ncbi:MAG: hypothetical protein RLZZ416_524 [Candidatus Parcubacteria bacterium]|jgi:spore coat polysaccharide biosynthesis protein SpsF
MTGAIIQARMSSTRLPGKVLLPLARKPVLFHVVERVKAAKRLDRVIVATSTEQEDDTIKAFCKERGYDCFRGSRDDVLSRYAGAAKQYKLDTVVRITSDCPLIDPFIVDQTIAAFESAHCDYISNVLPGERTFPRGLDCEVFSRAALEKADTQARKPYQREHVTPYVHENKTREFVIGPQVNASGAYARPQFRLTLDYPEDYELLAKLYDVFYKEGTIVSTEKVLAYLDAHPEIAALNAHCVQKTA